MAGGVLVGLAVDPMTYGPVGVGCVVGAGVLAVLGVRRRNRRGPARGPVSDVATDWEKPEDSFGNRRTSVRRDGPPVKILATSKSLRGTQPGFVIDRSTGGLKLTLGAAVPAGATVQVRAANAPETTPWVTVIVRSCRPVENRHELGCEFEVTPPWNVLLLFG